MTDDIQPNDSTIKTAEGFAQNASGTTEKTQGLSAIYAETWAYGSKDANNVLKDPAYC